MWVDFHGISNLFYNIAFCLIMKQNKCMIQILFVLAKTMEKYGIVDQDYGIRGIKICLFLIMIHVHCIFLRRKIFKKQIEYLYATPHTKKTIKSHIHSLIDWTNVNGLPLSRVLPILRFPIFYIFIVSFNFVHSLN